MAVSSLGFVLLTYGWKQRRLPQTMAGLAMMIYPYFVPAVIPMLLIAAALSGLLWLAVRLGW